MNCNKSALSEAEKSYSSSMMDEESFLHQADLSAKHKESKRKALQFFQDNCKGGHEVTQSFLDQLRKVRAKNHFYVIIFG